MSQETTEVQLLGFGRAASGDRLNNLARAFNKVGDGEAGRISALSRHAEGAERNPMSAVLGAPAPGQRGELDRAFNRVGTGEAGVSFESARQSGVDLKGRLDRAFNKVGGPETTISMAGRNSLSALAEVQLPGFRELPKSDAKGLLDRAFNKVGSVGETGVTPEPQAVGSAADVG